MAHIVIFILCKIHPVIYDIQQKQAALRVFNNMRVMLHIHTFEHEGHFLFLCIFLHFLQVFGSDLFPQHLLEISCVLAVHSGFAGRQQRVLVLVIAYNPQKSVLLYIGSDRKMQFMLQHLKFCLRTLIDVEKFIIGPGSHSALHCIQIQTSCLDSLGVPGSVIECLVRVIEGGNITEFLLHDIFVAAERNNGVRHGAADHRLFFLHLGRPVYLIFHLNAVNSRFVHLDASQAAAVFHLPFQVIHSVVYHRGHMPGIPVSVNLITIIRCSIKEGLRNLLEIIVIAHTLNHLFRGHKRQVFRHGAQARMSDQVDIVSIPVIRALTEFPVKLSYVLLTDLRGIQNRLRNQFKLSGPACAVICPVPEPSLVVPLQHQHILPVHDGEQEIHHLRVFHAAVNVIPHKDVHFIVLQAAVVLQVFLKNRIAAVDITDMMYLFVR